MSRRAPAPAADLTDPDDPSPRPGRGARWLVALPSRAPVFLFWTTLVVSLSVLGAAFTPWLVVPVLAGVLVLTRRWVADPVPVTRESVRGAAGALGLALAWLAANVWFAGEVLLVQRDAGFLTLEGLWLADHGDPDIPLRSAAAVADAIPGASTIADAFWRSGDVMYAQGAKTFPGLIALPGWIAGQSGVLLANLFIGAIALLAVYDVGRRLIGPRWALLPTGALALTTPMLFFSRSPFTEPVNLALTFGGLAVLWGAVQGRRQAGAVWPFALGGAMVGASALSRIDGAAVAAGVILGVGAIAALATDPGERRHLVRGFSATSAAACAMVLLGYLDVQVHSTGYLVEHRWLYVPLIAMFVAALAGACVAVAVGRWTRLPHWIDQRRGLLGRVTAWSVGVAFLVLASRPLWMVRHGVVAGSPQEWFVASAQKASGLPVDGTRSYDEMTLVWLSWYLGPVTVGLAAIGAALLARRALADRRRELVVLLITLGVPSVLYLVRPSITPDVVWAMRRFLPAVIPAVLLGAGWVLHEVVRQGRHGWLRVLGWIGVLVMLLAPLATWGPIIRTAEYQNRADEVAALCAEVRGGRVVVVRAAMDAPWLPTVRIACDADVVQVGAPADAAELARVREAWGGGEVFVMATSPTSLEWPDGVPMTFATAGARWPHNIRPGNDPVRFTSRMWLGRIGADGSVEPVDPAS